MANPNSNHYVNLSLFFDEGTLLQAAAIVAELQRLQLPVIATPSISRVPSYSAPFNERVGNAIPGDVVMPNISDVPTNEKAGNAVRDTATINALYECYLRNAPHDTAVTSIDEDDGMEEITDLSVLYPSAQRQVQGARGIPETSSSADSSATLFVEGLPASCTCRELAHLFRPFHGYEEVRLVLKEPKHPGGDLVVLGFVDFDSPAHAATAKDALQGYVFDEEDSDSHNLKICFSHTPGARSGFKNPSRQ